MLIAWTTGVKCLDAIIEAEGHDRVFGLFLPLFLNPVSPSLGISQQRTCIFDFCRGFRDEVRFRSFLWFRILPRVLPRCWIILGTGIRGGTNAKLQWPGHCRRIHERRPGI